MSGMMLLGTLLLCAAIATLLWPEHAARRFKKGQSTFQIMKTAGHNPRQEKDLKRKRRREIQGKSETLFQRFNRNIQAVSEITQTPIESYYRNAAVAALIGFIMGIALRNPLLAIMLAPVCWLAPFAKLLVDVSKHKKLLNEQLIDVLGAINSRFIAEPNLVLAIKKALNTMPQEARPHFEHFVQKVDLNMDVVRALEELGGEIENHFFHEWIRLAIQAAKGETGLRYTMMGIPQDMADHKSQYDDFEIEIFEHRRDFIISVAALPGTVILMYFSMSTFYGYLVNNIYGKVYLAMCVPAVLVLSYLFYRYNRRPDMA